MNPLTIVKIVLMAAIAFIAYFSWSKLVPGLRNVWLSTAIGILIGTAVFFFVKRTLNPPHRL